MPFSSDTSIFSVRPPAWLEAIAKPPDPKEIGKDLGMVLGGLGLWGADQLSGKPKEDKIGFREAVTQARMNQDDPQWQLRAEQMKSSLTSNWLRNQMTTMNIAEQTRDMATWAAHDLPELYNWREDLKDDPNTIPPIMESAKGHEALSQIQRGLTGTNIAKSSANAFQKMVEGLAARGGAAAAIAGKYAHVIGQIPTKQVLGEFGKDLTSLGLSEQDLIQESGLPLSKITTGPRGTTTTYGQEKPQSTLGKLVKDREEAEKSGAPAEVLSAYDAAIKKATEEKAGSPLGKLEADKAKAIEAGAPAEVISAYDAAIKKATAIPETLYTQKPEVIEVAGKKFLKWGKQLRDLSNSSAKEKVEVGLMASKIRTLQNEMIKNPETGEAALQKDSVTSQLRKAHQQLDKLLQSAPVESTIKTNPAAPAAPSTATNAPAATPAPVAASGLNFDEFSKWKQSE